MGEPRSDRRSERAGAALLASALLAALCALAWRGWFARYITDDYCSAAVLHDYGFWGAMKFQREIWSGRFTYYAVKGALEAIGPITARVTPALMIAGTALAVFSVFRSPLVALAATLAAVASAPDLFSSYGAFLWETGAVAYMLPVMLLIVWIGLFARAGNAVASFLLLFLAGGLSETTLAVQGAMGGGALLVALRWRDRRRIAIAASGVVATMLALAIMFTAPGNAVRAKIQPPRAPLVEAAAMALEHAYDFIGVHVFVEGAPLLIVLAAGAAIGARTARAVWAQTAGVAILCYVVSFFPSAWVISAPPPPRALYVSNVCVAVALFAAGGALGHAFRPRSLALGLLALVPLWSAYATVRTIPEAAVAAAQVDRIERLLHAQRGHAVVLRSRWALTSHWVGGDNGHPANRCMSWYFGLKSLTVVR